MSEAGNRKELINDADIREMGKRYSLKSLDIGSEGMERFLNVSANKNYPESLVKMHTESMFPIPKILVQNFWNSDLEPTFLTNSISDSDSST